MFQNEEIVFYQMNGFVLGTWLTTALETDMQRQGLARPGAFALAHNVASAKDVQATMDHLAKFGGRVLRPGDAPPQGGFRGYIADPDDHAWEIAWNPAWPISPEGYVSFSAPTIAARSDGAALAQLGDAGAVIAEVGKNVLGVLAELRRRLELRGLRALLMLIGCPTTLIAPSFLCCTGRAMPRCSTCGSANVLSMVLMGPHGTPALFNAAIQCALVLVRGERRKTLVKLDAVLRAKLAGGVVVDRTAVPLRRALRRRARTGFDPMRRC